jgi:hypothetical protein
VDFVSVNQLGSGGQKERVDGGLACSCSVTLYDPPPGRVTQLPVTLSPTCTCRKTNRRVESAGFCLMIACEGKVLPRQARHKSAESWKTQWTGKREGVFALTWVRLLGSGSHATAFPYGPIGTSLVPAQHRNSLPFSTSSQPLHKTPPVVIVPSLSWQTYAR